MYVGQTEGSLENRLLAHKRSGSKKVRAWMASLQCLPEIIVLQKTTPEKSILLELKWIKHYSKISPNLLNTVGNCVEFSSERKKETKTTFEIKIPAPISDALNQIAKKNKSTIEDIISYAISQYLDNQLKSK